MGTVAAALAVPDVDGARNDCACAGDNPEVAQSADTRMMFCLTAIPVLNR